jgi:Kdo2-lipid IVA lauroyltransferase/acyltransferase
VAKRIRKRRPTPWKWRAEWLAYVFVEKVAGALPGPWVFRVGEIMGGLAWHLMPLRRKIVLRNLRIAFCGEFDLPTLQQMARDTIRRTIANFFASAHTARLSADKIDAVLTVENQDLIERAMSNNAGLVLMPPHMGNWEILSRMNRLFPQGHKIGAFYRPLNNPFMNARVVAQRKTDGTYLFAKKDSLHHVSGFLRESSLIGILADQRVGKQGELVRFFGRLTRASPLPSLLARRSKSEVLTMSVITDSPGKWKIIFHPVNRPFKTVQCMESLERAMKASPLDVFWFQERWKVFVSPRHTIRDWLGPEMSEHGKPHRALLWLANSHISWQPPESWIHGDVNYEVVLATGQAPPPWLSGLEIIHTAPLAADFRTLQRTLAAIDLVAALPVDYILTRAASGALVKAAARESIRLVSLRQEP